MDEVYETIVVPGPLMVLGRIFLCAYIHYALYWRYYKNYPPSASFWMWLPVVGHLPFFAIAPRWFLTRAYKSNGRKPFVFDLFSHRFVVCGKEEIPTVDRAKEETLEMEAGVMKLLNFDLTLGKNMFKPVNNHGVSAQILTVRKDFTPNMDDHIGPMVDEILKVARDYFRKNNNNGTAIITDLNTFVRDVVAAAATRALLGKDLASNPVLMKEMKEFSAKVSEVVALSAVLPRSKLEKPAEKVRAAKDVISRYLVPVIQEKRRQNRSTKTNPEGEQDSSSANGHKEQEEPKTFLDYTLLQKEIDGKPLSDSRVTELICMMVFAAFDTTTYAVTHLLYDLAGQDDVRDKVLQEQRSLLTKQNDGNDDDSIRFLSSQAIKDMVVLEAALRESQRLSPGALTPVRMVMTDGVRCDNGKMTLPKGTLMAISPFLVHFDETVYPNPYEFRLDRFLPKNNSNKIAAKREFLSFGSGRHTCPGRFFATLEIKCIVSVLLSKYELSSPKLATYNFSPESTKRNPVPIHMKPLVPHNI